MNCQTLYSRLDWRATASLHKEDFEGRCVAQCASLVHSEVGPLVWLARSQSEALLHTRVLECDFALDSGGQAVTHLLRARRHL